jgi:hypothetical protein
MQNCLDMIGYELEIFKTKKIITNGLAIKGNCIEQFKVSWDIEF